MSELFPQPGLDGLILLPDFIDTDVEGKLIALVDSTEADASLQRRTWHFGSRYDYASSSLSMEPGLPIPELLDDLGRRLVQQGVFDRVPDQVLVNEYVSIAGNRQGIAPHRDRTDIFGDVVVTVSLLESWTMRFTKSDLEKVDVLLPRYSAVVLSGPARFEWLHEIQPRLHDKVGGVRVRRHRRVSVTFRTLKVVK